MVSRQTNLDERSEPATDRGSKLQSAGGQHKEGNVSPLVSAYPPPKLPSVNLAEKLKGSPFSITVKTWAQV